jgi:hypothetical protein
MTNPRSKNLVTKKLLDLGVVYNKKELYKKRKSGARRRNAADWLDAQEEGETGIPAQNGMLF